MFSIIVLAAGLGKRMANPNIPKVLTRLHDKPIIHYVLGTALSLNPDKIIVIVGHQRNLLIDYIKYNFSNKNIEFVVQEKQLGTGHATQCAQENFVNYAGNVLIMSGDAPLLKAHTLQNFINTHNEKDADISVLSAIAYNPIEYGRIVRDINGGFVSITEEKDADEQIRNIKEINSGIYYLSGKLLFDLLTDVKNNNVQNEYYLTDIVSISKNLDKKVIANIGATFEEIQGINTPDQLAYVEGLMTLTHI